jgi:hypothetical protein
MQPDRNLLAEVAEICDRYIKLIEASEPGSATILSYHLRQARKVARELEKESKDAG